MSASISAAELPLPKLELLRGEGLKRSNPALFYLGRLSPGGSEAGQRSTLKIICEWLLPGSTIQTFPWSALRHEHTLALRSHLAGRYAASTANRMISALRGALRMAWRLEQLTTDQFERACDLRQVRGERLMRGRWVPAKDIAELFHAAKFQEPELAARDTALLWLLFGGGLRRCEVCRLDRRDITKEDGTIFVRVTGKNNKQGRVPLPPQAVKPMLAYLRRRGSEPGPLFISQKKCRPCGVTLGNWVIRMAERAMIRHTTAHDFRRSYISALLDRGADLATVQKMARHERPETTARYDRRPEATRVKIAGLLTVPEARPVLAPSSRLGGKVRARSSASSPARNAV